MEVTYKEIKSIRKVQSIEFTFIDHEPRKYNFEGNTLIEPKEISLSDEVVIDVDNIDSIDYMELINCKLNESIHSKFLEDYHDYKNYIAAVEIASERTLSTIGGKTINKRNYKYFKTTLENLIPSQV